MKRSGLYAAATLVIIAVLALSAIGLSPKKREALALMPDHPDVVAVGDRVYSEHCAACHGVNLEGQPNWRSRGDDGLLPAPPHDVTGHTWHHPDTVLITLTKYGPGKLIGDPNYRTNMPSYANVLSDEEIVAVLSYIKSRWPDEIRERHDSMNAAQAGR